ncbi:hypothetical protein ACI2IX_18245 [Leifsonia aquatica]|uniref:hypothetical protein n=1 Tax=Leifsonia aquatica TaxID=144185 RepID=UPI00384F50E2
MANLWRLLVAAARAVALTGGAPLFPRRIESDRLTLESAEAIGQFARLRYRVRSS